MVDDLYLYFKERKYHHKRKGTKYCASINGYIKRQTGLFNLRMEIGSAEENKFTTLNKVDPDLHSVQVKEVG